MNKKMIAIAVAAVAIISVMAAMTAVKATYGDKATELPGEEGAEKTLHLQESPQTNQSSGTGESSSSEAGESGAP